MCVASFGEFDFGYNGGGELMELLRQWLFGITGTTLLLAVADSLMPSGSVKQVGRLICGLLLLIMIVKPVLQLSQESLEEIGAGYQSQLTKQEKEMENYYNNQLKIIIEQNIATYILDKAMELGVRVQPFVVCQLGEDDIFEPVSVVIEECPVEIQMELMDILCEELSLDATQIQMKEAFYEDMELPLHS